jgi:hypothetical protein
MLLKESCSSMLTPLAHLFNKSYSLGTSGYSYKLYSYAGAQAPALEIQLLAEKPEATNTDKLTFYMIQTFLGQGYLLCYAYVY